jgi:arginyl-tRNA synthetase
MKDEIISSLRAIINKFGYSTDIELDFPKSLDFGDFSTNIAMRLSKEAKLSPMVLANKIVEDFRLNMPSCIKEVNVATPGFINIWLNDMAIAQEVINIANKKFENKKERGTVMVEFTDPNPFKVFHIGHLMSNTIGESIARLYEYRGYKVIRANWQGDVGLHVAKTLWAILSDSNHNNEIIDLESKSLKEKVSWLGAKYVIGAKAYDGESKKEIDELNEKIFKRTDEEVNGIYDIGRKWSLDYFETIYDILGTKFDNYFFEGIEGRNGETVVREFLKKGFFRESEGAIIFDGTQYGVHTRVFINSRGLPTYETKEIGLNIEKFKLYPDLKESVIITANEQNDYFKVLLKVFSLILPDIGNKTKHIGHGMMRFSSGKMGSRTGNVIAGDSLIQEIKTMVLEKMKDSTVNEIEKDMIATQIAISAIKFTILRQSIGNDIIFDSSASISFEGDSGPYLQYSAVRAQSVLNKAQSDDKYQDIFKQFQSRKFATPDKAGELERLILKFDDIVKRSYDELAPQFVAHYLIKLAGAFNSFYANNIILNEKDGLSAYRLAITQLFRKNMEKGLWVLGIQVPDKM